MLSRDALKGAERLAKAYDLDPNTFEPMYRPGYEPWLRRQRPPRGPSSITPSPDHLDLRLPMRHDDTIGWMLLAD